MRRSTVVLLALLLCGAWASASATTWYVRSDGGTRWSANRVSASLSAQCNGQVDASYASAYAAAGSPAAIPNGGLPCAYNDYRFMWDDQATYGVTQWVIAGGDTVIFDNTQTWRVGFDVSGDTNWCRGGNGAYSCTNPAIPAGTSAAHTRLLGRNWQSCVLPNGHGDHTKMSKVFGGHGVYEPFNLAGTQYVDVQCVEISRFGECWNGDLSQFTSPNGATALPNCAANPANEYASQGVATDNTSANIFLTNDWIHSFTDSGLKGPWGGPINLQGVDIEANASAGINTDSGCDTTDGSCTANMFPAGAALNMTYSTIAYSGCIFGVDGKLRQCADQNHQGYGDGTGSAACLWYWADGTCRAGQWADVKIDHSILAYNVQDSEDFGHMDGGHKTIQVTNNLIVGNGGGAVKFGWGFDNVTINDNLILHNCARLTGSMTPLAVASSNFFDPITWQDLCRSGDTFSFNFNNATTATIHHNTVISYAPTTWDYKCIPTEIAGGTGSSPQPNCNNAVMTETDNAILLYTEVHQRNGADGLANTADDGYGGTGFSGDYCGASCNNANVTGTGGGSSPKNGNNAGLIGTWNRSNNIYFNTRYCPANNQSPDTVSGTSVNERCVDPHFTGEPLYGTTPPYVTDLAGTLLDNFNFQLTSASPAVGTGVAISGVTADYTGAAFASSPSLGALEYPSAVVGQYPFASVVSIILGHLGTGGPRGRRL